MSIDRGTVRWRALTGEGANGPIMWEIDGDALQPFGVFTAAPVPAVLPRDWVEVATEKAVQRLEPLAEWQRAVLVDLARMNT